MCSLSFRELDLGPWLNGCGAKLTAEEVRGRLARKKAYWLGKKERKGVRVEESWLSW